MDENDTDGTNPFVTARTGSMLASPAEHVAMSKQLMREAGEQSDDRVAANLLCAAQTHAFLSAVVGDLEPGAPSSGVSVAHRMRDLVDAEARDHQPAGAVVPWSFIQDTIAEVLRQVTAGKVEHQAEYEPKNSANDRFLRGWDACFQSMCDAFTAADLLPDDGQACGFTPATGSLGSRLT